MKQVDLTGLAVDASGSPILLLRELDDPHRTLPIFIGPLEAASIGIALSGQHPPRPLTHDLMAVLVEQLDGHLDAVEVVGFEGGTFIASLTMHGPAGIEQRIDTRPSDAIALAIRLGAPLFVSESVLDEAAAVVIDEEDHEDELAAPASDMATDPEVEAALDDFRAFLDTITPTDFATPGALEDTDPDDAPDP